VRDLSGEPGGGEAADKAIPHRPWRMALPDSPPNLDGLDGRFIGLTLLLIIFY